ncbi:threalose-6-phosphate phosphatase [Xanthoria calcicola]
MSLAMGKPSMLDFSQLADSYQNSDARLFLLDWDGTLTAIVGDPEAAVPTPADIEVLERLSSNPKNDLWIISGRNSAFLQKHLGCLGSVGLSAEHGAFVRLANRTDWEIMFPWADITWQETIMAIFEDYTAKTQGSWIERKSIAITWHYRNALPDIGLLNSKECKDQIEQCIAQMPSNLEVINGKMCLEVRPRDLNKGVIVRSIIMSYGGRVAPPDFVLCMGDDVTDEDMFKAIWSSGLSPERCFTVLVGQGSRPTTASWSLPEPADVMDLLGKLAAAPTKVHSEL